MPEFDENKALAILLTDLGKKKRTENLLKIAEYCVYLRDRYGTWSELAKRVNISDERAHISAEMLREFGAILELPDEVKQMIKDNLIISVDIAYRISLLEQKSDKISLASTVVDKKLPASDVRAIVEYKMKNPNVTIDQATQRVLESKSKVVMHHIVIMELSETTLAALRKEAEKSRQSPENLTFAILGKKWNRDRILSFGMRGGDIILKLSEDGFKALQQKARISSVELKDLAENLIRNALQGTK